MLFFWWIGFAAVRSTSPGSNLLLIAMLLLLGVCCSGMLIPGVAQVRSAARRITCQNNMRQLALAMYNYESAHSRFPTARIGDEFPYSWRVELLPFLDEQPLRSRYDENQAWDSPKNLKWAESIPGLFSCPSKDHGKRTPYKLVTGPGTLFDESSPPTFDKISDGATNTIMMIEDHRAPVLISDPGGDLNIDEAVKLLCEMDPRSAPHYSDSAFETTYIGTCVVFCDGSTGIIGFNADPQVLRDMFLCADGNFHQRDSHLIGQTVTIFNWSAVVSFSIYVILLSLPAIFLFREYLQRSHGASNHASNQSELSQQAEGSD